MSRKKDKKSTGVKKNVKNDKLNMSFSGSISKSFLKEISRTILCICIIFLVLGTAILVNGMTNLTRADAKYYAEKVNNIIQSRVGILNSAAAGVSGDPVKDREDIQAYVDSIVAIDDTVSAVYSCYNENITIMSGGWQPPEDFVVTERSWYKDSQANPDKVCISTPYVDEQSGGMCITLSKATFTDGKQTGVMGVDLYLDDLQSLIDDSKDGGKYSFITTSDGDILLHPSKKFSMGVDNVKNIKKANGGSYKALNGKDLKIHAILDYDGGLKCATNKQDPMTGWQIVTVHTVSEALIFGIALIVIGVVIFFVSLMLAKKNVSKKCSKLFRPIENIGREVPRLAEGDLSVQFDEEPVSVEVVNLTEALNSTVDSFRNYINAITDTVTDISKKNLDMKVEGEFKGDYLKIKEALNTIIDSLNTSLSEIVNEAQTVLEFANELERTTEAVADSAEGQTGSIKVLSENVSLLMKQTEEITLTAREIKKDSDVTNSLLSDGSRELRDLVKAMNSVAESYEKISGFVSEINEMAEQTNLLALNASIEAARAGEAGKGFAVVADEISKLAASSSGASNNIEELMAETNLAVEKGMRLVESTNETMISGINASVGSKEKIDRIVSYVSNQQAAITKINTEINSLAEEVETNAASAQENAAISGHLISCAEKLKDTVDEYKL